jgi:hypothetical protein
MSLRRAFGRFLAFAGRPFRLPDPLGDSPRQKLRRATRPVVDELEKRTMLTALPAFVHLSGNVVVGCNLQGDGSMLTIITAPVSPARSTPA